MIVVGGMVLDHDSFGLFSPLPASSYWGILEAGIVSPEIKVSVCSGFSYPFLEAIPPTPHTNVGLYSLNPFQDCFSFFFQPQNKPVPTCPGPGKKEGPNMASSCAVFMCFVFF